MHKANGAPQGMLFSFQSQADLAQAEELVQSALAAALALAALAFLVAFAFLASSC